MALFGIKLASSMQCWQTHESFQCFEAATRLLEVDGCYTPMVETNYFASGEKNIGSFDGSSACIAAAKEQCPDFDLVNMNTGELTGTSGYISSCWCQHSNG